MLHFQEVTVWKKCPCFQLLLVRNSRTGSIAYSKYFCLQTHQAPEVLRVPLHQLCLTLRAALPSFPSVAEAMDGLLTPPSSDAVGTAVRSLKSMGAMAEADALTMLGQHLARMPMDPRLGKALIYGAMLR